MHFDWRLGHKDTAVKMWFCNNLKHARKYTCVTFFPSWYKAKSHWGRSKKQRGFFSLFFFFPFCALHTHICAFSEVYLPIVILFICLLYLLACQHCIIQKPCDSYWDRWGCCDQPAIVSIVFSFSLAKLYCQRQRQCYVCYFLFLFPAYFYSIPVEWV